MSAIYKGTIIKISGVKITNTNFKKKVILLKPQYGKEFPIQVHPQNFDLLESFKEGDKVTVSAKCLPAGTTDTVNIIVNGISR